MIAKRTRSRFYPLAVLIVGLVMSGSPIPVAARDLPVPVVATVTADTQAGRLTILGRNFVTSPAPRVQIGNGTGAFQDLVVESATSSLIVARLGAMAPGTYRVVVRFGYTGLVLSTIDVTVGVAGAHGEKGEKGDKGDKGDPGVAGQPGPPGAAATVRDATLTECATGGIVAASGDGSASLPVCNGARGERGQQGVEGKPGPAGPPGPAGGAPVIDPATRVGFGGNLVVSIDGADSDRYGLSPITVEVETLSEVLGNGLVRYFPGAIRLAPFAIASSRPNDVEKLEAWFSDVRNGDLVHARRPVSVELHDVQGDTHLTVELANCVPTSLSSSFDDADGMVVRTAIVDCDDNVALLDVVGGTLGIHSFGGSLALGVDGRLQRIADVSGGDERLVGQQVAIDPLRMRVATLQNVAFKVEAIVDWIVASLSSDPDDADKKLRNIELQRQQDADTFIPIATFQDVFLTSITLIDPRQSVGSAQTILMNFDLVMQPNGRQ
jgi:hypothetical protein